MHWADAPGPDRDPVEAALAAVRSRTDFAPDVVLVLGSGLREALPAIDDAVTVAFSELPGFPVPTAPGHEGSLVMGTCAGVRIAAFCGRVHYYETRRMSACSMTVRLGRALGAGAAVVTAAVGGLSENAAPGSLVVLEDHVNLMGVNPLEGWRFPDGSPAFVDLSTVYPAAFHEVALEAARALRIECSSGVYAALAGPTYETAAESAFLRKAGADVVGMSMVPETVAAHAIGMRVLGLAFVVNEAGTAIDHASVLAEGHAVAAAAGSVLAAILPRL